ncbi:MAG: hypothetical protein K2Y05_01825 [Hyphomicrobiaceae bacterium]|nr:hypothetical protein [Hyphomicrobiaceae bacterium]
MPTGPKVMASGSLGVLTVLMVGLAIAKWLGPSAPSISSPPSPSVLETDVLSRLGFVDQRTPMQLVAIAERAVKPRSAQELASLMAGSAAQTIETQLEDVPTDHGVITVAAASGTAVDQSLDANHLHSGPTVPGDVLAAVPAKLPPIAVSITRSNAGITTADLPVDIDVASPRNSRIMIGRIPSGVAFSAGQPVGPGLWQMRVGEFAGARILLDPSAPNMFELALMLLDTEGTVVNGIDIAFTANAPSGSLARPTPIVASRVILETRIRQNDPTREFRRDSGSRTSSPKPPNKQAEPRQSDHRPPIALARPGTPVSSPVAPAPIPAAPIPPMAPASTTAAVVAQPAATNGPAGPLSGLGALFPSVKPGEPANDLSLQR